MSNFKDFKEIRAKYAQRLPEWIEGFERDGEMRHCPYFHEWRFSPIEDYVFNDIRAFGLPFYPQFPVLNYFLDFGCPFLKIGIECDGKQWHDAERDARRDARLANEGWMIFRITGSECIRSADFNDLTEHTDKDAFMRRFYMQTSEGLLTAIQRTYFMEPEYDYQYRDLVDETLGAHISTQSRFVDYRPKKRLSEPKPARDAMNEHMETINKRVEKAKKNDL